MISYVISYHDISSLLPWPVQWARTSSKAAPSRFKCTPVQIKCSSSSSPMCFCPLWLRNQVAVVYQSIEDSSDTRPAPSAPPAPPSPSFPASEASLSFSFGAGA